MPAGRIWGVKSSSRAWVRMYVPCSAGQVTRKMLRWVPWCGGRVGPVRYARWSGARDPRRKGPIPAHQKKTQKIFTSKYDQHNVTSWHDGDEVK